MSEGIRGEGAIDDLKGASMVWGCDWSRRSVGFVFVSFFSVAHRQQRSMIAGDCDQPARVRRCRVEPSR
jgi:hypothetical protein